MIKARMKFNKSGSMKFIGHLDVMRYFQKAIRRSEIDVCYSQGFNPHQQLSFASPLGVGLTSDGEYMDIQLNSITSSEDIKNRLNATMTEEMQILNVKVLPEDSKTSMALLAAADYKVEYSATGASVSMYYLSAKGSREDVNSGTSVPEGTLVYANARGTKTTRHYHYQRLHRSIQST